MNHQLIKDLLVETGISVAHRVHQSLRQQTIEQRSAVFKEGDDDLIFTIDRDVEEVIVPIVQRFAPELGGVHLLAEGIGEDTKGVRMGVNPKVKIIMDPIDGTRGIMYDKRSAFFLAAAAPDHGDNTMLSHAEVAVMVELPNSRSVLADVVYCIKGEGVKMYTLNLETGEKQARLAMPSKAKTLVGGFAQFARFFPPGREVLARIEDKLIETITSNFDPAKAIIFEDQYISTGGQMYQMLVGHDRFTADLRWHLYTAMEKRGKKGGHVCHPYDACTMPLIASESGLVLTDGNGYPFDAPMDLMSPVDWILYANKDLHKLIWPTLRQLLIDEDMLSI